MKEIRPLPVGEGTYELHRKQVKHINLRVTMEGTVRVSASPRVPLERIETFLRQQAQFIENAVSMRQQSRGRQCMTPSIGMMTTILGVPYEVKPHPSRTNGGQIEVDEVYRLIYCPSELSPDCYTTVWKNFWKDWGLPYMNSMAQKVYDEFTQAGYVVPRPVLRLQAMTSRWGSCQPKTGRMTMNSRLLLGPERCIHYVLVHEFAHFIEANHSHRFHAVVTRVLPEWKAIKQEMNAFFQGHI